MKKLFIFLMTVILTSVTAMAQNEVIKGTVVSASDGEPLIGASVVAENGQGEATNIDGEFSLRVAPGTILKVSYLGYVLQSVPAADGMVIRLKPNENSLDEVVVTGYGTAKKLGSFVGAASVVGSAQIENTPAASFVDALQGAVPGLGIFSNTGEPASAPANINIRGYSSLEFSVTPLFILDGSPVSSAVFTSLNPNDIESITVLKDAASTAIYGSRAGNGVIVITSKKGKLGESGKVTIRASVGWSAPVESGIEMMNSQQYLKFRDDMTEAFGSPKLDGIQRDLITKYGIDTDWRDEMIKSNALTYSFEAAVRGGSEKSNYFLSLGHYDQDGLIAKSGLRRETLRASFNADVKPWLRVGFSGNLAYEKYETNSTAAQAGRFYTNGPIFQAYYALPYESPYLYSFDENGNISFGEKANWLKYSLGGQPNANFVSALNTGSTNQVTINASIFEEIRPIRGLVLRAQQSAYAYDRRASTRWNATEDYELPMGGKTNFGQYTERISGESFGRLYQFTYTNTAEYTNKIADDHEFTLLLGQESIINRTNSFGVSTEGQPSNDLMLITNGTSVKLDNLSQSISEYVVNSYFLTADYNFNERYYFNGSVRRDGCSKFAPQHRWSTFYALGLMWNAKNESFLSPITWIDALQVRANFGTAGNYSGLGDFAWHGALGTGTNYHGQPTMGLTSPSNPDLTWETIQQFSAGINYSLFNRRLYGTVDYYIKDTKDLILDVPYSYTTGWSSNITNIGSLRNSGVDFEIGSDLYRDKDWYVGIKANFNYNHAEVVELFNGQTEYRLDDYGLVYVVGENPFQLNAVRYAGVDKRDGKCMWYDKNGNLTKVYNEEDAVNLGKAWRPSWTGGFGLNVAWKGLALRADFTWAADKYIYNWAYQQLASNLSFTQGNQSVKMLNTWTPNNPEGTMPAITEAIQGDTRYLENSSYLRMKNITVSYNLPKSWLKKVDMSDVTFRFTGRNLLTFTSDEFTGIDPEYVGNGVRLQYPNTRQYEFGVEVSF